jgi:peroxiredoxin
MGIRVIAASVDNEAGARKISAENKLTLPVAYGLTVDQIKQIGAFTGDRESGTYNQPTEFVLRPGGEVAASMYSTMQLGRMKPREVLQFLKSRIGG